MPKEGNTTSQNNVVAFNMSVFVELSAVPGIYIIVEVFWGACVRALSIYFLKFISLVTLSALVFCVCFGLVVSCQLQRP